MSIYCMIDCSYADYNKKKNKKMTSNDTSIKFSPVLEFKQKNMYIRTT